MVQCNDSYKQAGTIAVESVVSVRVGSCVLPSFLSVGLDCCMILYSSSTHSLSPIVVLKPDSWLQSLD